MLKQDSDNSPSVSIALSGNRSVRELTEIADKVVKVQVERANGVGEVQIVGGLERAMSIWVEADRLAAYQLSIADVRNALQQQVLSAGHSCTRSPDAVHSFDCSVKPQVQLQQVLLQST